jgi:magnesium-protoporphyrin O-methyltransferase
VACTCRDYGLDEVFTARSAQRDAARYRKRGLPQRSRRLLQLIETFIDMRGRRSLEGGAGVGALTIELARKGVVDAQAVDATPVAMEYATRLAHEFGVADRTRFQSADFADPKLAAAPADLVILDRVVCCYPDWRALLANATSRARHVIALSYPADSWYSHVFISTVNTCQSLFRRRFRVFVHPPQVMLALLAQHGFDRVERRRHWSWELAVAARDNSGSRGD